MVLKEIREKLPEDSLVFDNYSYDTAIIGVTLDGRAIYCYGKMVTELMQEEDMSYEEACEWIDYNTIRALPYAGEKAPVIMYSMEE
ncbi:hypothetical protein [Methanobrevibacter sp.]|uniref:hypothetical protein n=1 Tax=Methanobrevibacter sp. TaxID=66852 RepID=UPI0038905327